MIITNNGIIVTNNGVILNQSVPTVPAFANQYSMVFNGVDDRIDCGDFDSSALTALSISVWVKTDFTTGGDATNIGYIVTKDNVSAGRDFALLYRGTGTNKLYFSFWSPGGTYSFVGSSTFPLGNPADGNWHHILGTWDGTTDANKMQLFVDGSLVGQATANDTGVRDSPTTELTIGGPDTTINTRLFYGNIDEVAIFNGDVSANVAEIYNLGIPNDLTSLNPLKWYRMGENAVFRDPQWLLPSNENKDKVSNYSMSFDGVNDGINCSNTSLGITNAISVSVWVKTTDTSFVFRTIVAEDNPSGVQRNWQLLLNSSNKIAFIFFNTSGTQNYLVRATALEVQDGNWHHIVATYDGTTDADGIKIYIDGGNVETLTALSTGIRSTSTVGPTIGYNSNGSWNFKGNIDEVAIWDSVLSSENITSIYNLGTPTDLTSLSPLAYYKMGEDATFRDPQWLIPNNENKDNYSNYSLSFDGTNDYVDFGVWDLLDGQSIFTLSLWIKSGVDASNAYVIARVEGQPQFLVFQNGTANSLKYRIYTTTATYTIIGGAVLDNQWHHCMMVYNGSTFEVFEDGASVSSTSANGSLVTSTSRLRVATFGGSAPFKSGNIDEISIFNTDQTSNISTLSTSPITDISSLNPIGWWKMGEDATFDGTNWTVPDIVGSNPGTSANMDISDRVGDAPGSANNALSINMDRFDQVEDVPPTFNFKSLVFDGVNDYLRITPTIPIGLLSISFWMKSTDLLNGSVTSGMGNLGFIAVGAETLPILQFGSANYQYFVDQRDKFDGQWHHWFILTTGSAQADILNSRLFVNGIEIAKGSGNASGAANAPGSGYIGKGQYGPLACYVDEFAVWQSDQTSKIATIYNLGIPNDISSLNPVSWWRMGEDDTFPTITDIGSGSSNGTMLNMDASDIVTDVPT